MQVFYLYFPIMTIHLAIKSTSTCMIIKKYCILSFQNLLVKQLKPRSWALCHRIDDCLWSRRHHLLLGDLQTLKLDIYVENRWTYWETHRQIIHIWLIIFKYFGWIQKIKKNTVAYSGQKKIIIVIQSYYYPCRSLSFS